jgi:uncharacterized caspase-like protein
MRRFLWLLLGFLCLCIASAQAKEEGKTVKAAGLAGDNTEGAAKWAILIGVNHYQDPNIQSLNFSAADARALAAVLTDPNIGGFPSNHVLLLTDDAGDSSLFPTRRNIMDRVSEFLALPGTDDTLLFFYSGHGAQPGNNSYILPMDARVETEGGKPSEATLALTSISVSYLLEQLQACRANKKVLILDSCHSGAAKVSGEYMGNALSSTLASGGAGLVSLSSCTLAEQSYEYKEEGHGAFTYFLVEGLKGAGDRDGDGEVVVSEANRYVHDKTYAWANSRRVSQTPIFYGFQAGDIVLTGKLKENISGAAQLGSTPSVTSQKMAKPALAVVPFQVVGEDQSHGVAFASELTTSLSKTQRFNLLEGSGLAKSVKVVGEEEPAGDLASLAVAGKTMGAQVMVTGTIEVGPASSRVNVRLIDTATGQISQSEREEGPQGQGLADGLAERIADAYPIVGTVIKQEGDTFLADVGAVNGVVSGMRFQVSREQSIETLLGIKTLSSPVGEAEVVDVQGDFCRARSNTAVQERDKIKSVGQAFGQVQVQATGTLSITSVPDGATLFLDGRPAGQTPWEGRVEARTYQVVIKKEGYAQHTGNAEVKPDTSQHYTATLLALQGTLEITSSPNGATVFLDGQGIGTTPLSKQFIAGQHTIIVELADHRRWQSEVAVQPEEVTKVSASLAEEMGSLRVTSNPDGAKVLLDGVDIGVAPLLVAEVSPGNHQVSLSAPGCANALQTVTITGQKETAVSFELQRTKISIDLKTDRKDKTYKIGSDIQVSFKPSQDCYLNIYDVSPAGTLFRLYPNNYAPEAKVRGKTQYKIPDKDYGVGLHVDPPEGQETLIAVASPEEFSLGIEFQQFGSYQEALLFIKDKIESVSARSVEELTFRVVK